jgi:PAS domain S-box-containing protein
MDIRTKLVFGFVAVSLSGLLALGALAYTSAAQIVDSRAELQLASLAEAKAEQVDAVFEGWVEVMAQITSRTQLRQSLRGWNRNEAPAEEARIARILEDALASSDVIEALTVLDLQGRRVASVGSESPTLEGRTSLGPADTGVSFSGFSRGEPPHVGFSAPLVLDGRVGTILAELSTTKLSDLAQNTTGLGETGETLVTARDADGQVRLLSPRRHPVEPSAPGEQAPDPSILRLALDEPDHLFSRDMVDDHGESVWIATRRIEHAGLGIAVKFDETEQRADINQLRDRLLGVGFSLSAFAILLGVLMGLAVARPIHDLAEVADQIREGDLTARANAEREDELGLLGRTFNDMSVELERRMSELQEYKTFFDESRDLLCIAGTDGYFKRLNPAFKEVLGWSVDELLGQPFVEFVHPDDVQSTLGELEKLGGGIPTISFENRYRCKDGSYKRLLWGSHPDPETGLIYAIARES